MSSRRFFGALLVGSALIFSVVVIAAHFTDPRPMVSSHD